MKISRFLAIASTIAGKKSPSVFLKENDAFLRTFPKCGAVLCKLDSGAMFPTPALASILLLLSREKDVPEPVKVKAAKPGKEKSAVEPRAPKAEKRYLIIVQGNKGWDIHEVLHADTFGEAERRAFNRIYVRTSDCFAEIISIADGMTTKVDYDAAARYVLAAKMGGKQSCRNIVTSGKMQSVKNYVAHFSNG